MRFETISTAGETRQLDGPWYGVRVLGATPAAGAALLVDRIALPMSVLPTWKTEIQTLIATGPIVLAIAENEDEDVEKASATPYSGSAIKVWDGVNPSGVALLSDGVNYGLRVLPDSPVVIQEDASLVFAAGAAMTPKNYVRPTWARQLVLTIWASATPTFAAAPQPKLYALKADGTPDAYLLNASGLNVTAPAANGAWESACAVLGGEQQADTGANGAPTGMPVVRLPHLPPYGVRLDWFQGSYGAAVTGGVRAVWKAGS